MPTYDYKCSCCLTVIEHTQPIDSIYVPPCPDCGRPMHKLFAPVGIVFKGSGWAGKVSNGTHKTGAARSSEGGDTKGSDSTSKAKAKESSDSSP